MTVELQEFSNARDTLLEARDLIVADFDEKHPANATVLMHLVSLFEEWAQVDPGRAFDVQAAEWRAKLANVQKMPRRS